MAKWGEGDPRWIVEERPDATNVNNWHWTEKNATGWSKEKLKELLTGLVIENSDVFCEIKELTSIEGEATANNRKAKLIFFYEWVIKGEWSGKLKEGDKKYKGKFEIPNLSEEHEPDEVDVNVTVDKNTDDAHKIKEVMRKVGTPQIQLQLAKYIKQLKEEYSQDVIKPTGKTQPDTSKSTPSVNTAKVEMSKMMINGDTKDKESKSLGVKIATKSMTGEETFHCSPQQLYRAFTDKEMVQAFTRAPATLEVEKGGRISLMNGHVTGGFIELVPDKKIMKRWHLKTWPDAHFSEVTLEFLEKDGDTVLKFKQTGIPSSEYDRTKEFWKVNYWQRIKQTFGFGAILF